MIYYIFVLLIMTILYLDVFMRKKTFINLLFFLYVDSGLIMIFPYVLNLGLNNKIFQFREGDFYIIFYVLFVYIAAYLIEIKGSGFKTKQMRSNFSRKNLCLILGLFLIAFWLKNIDLIKLAISNPRMFYANTRIGGGLIYYAVIPIIIFLYFCYITKLGYKNKYKKDLFKAAVATILTVGFIYIFGQKSMILTIVYLLLTTIGFKLKRKNNNKIIFRIGIVSVFGFIAIFALYCVQQNIPFINFFYNVSNYADYINNFNDLVEELDTFYLGRIFLENETLPYIPRFIWSNKPELFGSLQLGLNVPRLVEWTKSLTGAPSFGPIGTAYADFGFLGVILYSLLKIFLLLIGRGYEKKLERKYNFWDHFLFLTFVVTHIAYTSFISTSGNICFIYFLFKTN